jgi:hypothetical protein
MSLPNAITSRKNKFGVENAQFITMLCKGEMNFVCREKKWRETAGAVPATMPGFFGGGLRAKPI